MEIQLREGILNSKTKGIIVYLVLAFSIAWIPLIIQWFLGLRGPGEDASFWDYAVFLLITLPTSFGPAIGALVVRKWVTGEGFTDAGLRLHLRQSWKYYLFALLYPVIIVPGTLILERILSSERPDYSSLTLVSLMQMTIIALISTPIVWGEEFGWRGYLQIRLFAGQPVRAAIATGLIWAIWHYPMIMMGYIFSGNPLGLLLYPINMVITSVIYGWLQMRSGSVWPVSLAHAAGNTMINPLLASLLPTLTWPLVWAGYRGAILVMLSAWIILRDQPKAHAKLSPI